MIATFKAGDTSLTGSTTYDPFGKPITAVNLSGRLGYQSGWTDPITNKVNMWSRWYDPTAGQFRNKDTVDVNPVPDSAAANSYAYVAGNPLLGTDPDGHCSRALVACSSLGGGALSWLGSIATKPVKPSLPPGPKIAPAQNTSAPKQQNTFINAHLDALRDRFDVKRKPRVQIEKILDASEKVVAGQPEEGAEKGFRRPAPETGGHDCGGPGSKSNGLCSLNWPEYASPNGLRGASEERLKETADDLFVHVLTIIERYRNNPETRRKFNFLLSVIMVMDRGIKVPRLVVFVNGGPSNPPAGLLNELTQWHVKVYKAPDDKHSEIGAAMLRRDMRRLHNDLNTEAFLSVRSAYSTIRVCSDECLRGLRNFVKSPKLNPRMKVGGHGIAFRFAINESTIEWMRDKLRAMGRGSQIRGKRDGEILIMWYWADFDMRKPRR